MAALPTDLFAVSCPFEPDNWSPRRLPSGGGVYLLADADDKPVLLAAAMNLRTVVHARLSSAETEPRSRRAKLSEVVRRVHWTPVFSRFEADLRHCLAALELFPRDWRERVGFGPAYFLRADPSERTPRFKPVSSFGRVSTFGEGIGVAAVDDAATPRPATPPGARSCDGAPRYLGPFPARSDAEDFVRMLEDVFDLCRKHEELDRAPLGQACAYFDMGRCPAPCNGTAPLEEYRLAFARAAAFAAGLHDEALSELEQRMRQAAAEQQFEKAASLRETIQRARRCLDREANRLVRELSDFRWLILQPGSASRARAPQRQIVKPFLAVGRMLIDAPAVSVAGMAETWPVWTALLSDSGSAAAGCSAGDNRADAGLAGKVTVSDEAVWLTCRYLFGGAGSGGLFMHASELPAACDACALAPRIFARTRRAAPSSADQLPPRDLSEAEAEPQGR